MVLVERDPHWATVLGRREKSYVNEFSRTMGGVLAIVLVATLGSAADAFIFDDSSTPWLRTASGSRSGNGVPGTLTWSIVPDGTSVSDGNQDLGGSDLVEYLNETFDGDPDQTDHTQQPWFSIFEDSFARWDELSGLTFVYEPNDDGVANDSRRRGILGRRGDIRISGASVDGSGGVLAFNFLPEFGGDMTLDTDERSFADTSGNFRFFRNTVMHELGHAFGLSHVASDSDSLLMEPFTQTTFDGPQLDEIRAIQFFFGDALEEANDGQGNGTVPFATELGPLRFGDEIEIGGDASRVSQRVSSRRSDYVSISNLNDVDFYEFTVDEYASLTAQLTPEGGTFNQSGELGIPTPFDADARSPLSLALFDSTGEYILDEMDLDLGQPGSLSDITVEPGTYYARVTGGEDTIQLYNLELELSVLPGDYNMDGLVDGADFTIWRDALNSRLAGDAAADGNGNGIVDQDDFQIWVDQFGTSYRASPMRAAPVPEPHLSIAWIVVLATFLNPRRSRTSFHRQMEPV